MAKNREFGQVRIPLHFPFENGSLGAFRDQIEKKQQITKNIFGAYFRTHSLRTRGSPSTLNSDRLGGLPGPPGPQWLKNSFLVGVNFHILSLCKLAHLGHFGAKFEEKKNDKIKKRI